MTERIKITEKGDIIYFRMKHWLFKNQSPSVGTAFQLTDDNIEFYIMSNKYFIEKYPNYIIKFQESIIQSIIEYSKNKNKKLIFINNRSLFGTDNDINNINENLIKKYNFIDIKYLDVDVYLDDDMKERYTHFIKLK